MTAMPLIESPVRIAFDYPHEFNEPREGERRGLRRRTRGGKQSPSGDCAAAVGISDQVNAPSVLCGGIVNVYAA